MHALGVEVEAVRHGTGLGVDDLLVFESIARRNSIGSLPAACASSSMNDWNTKQNALLRGARMANVGTPIGMVVAGT